MKKTSSVILIIMLICTTFTGCGKSILGDKVKVYSVSGENKQFRISNAVIVLSPSEDIFYDGNLEWKQTGKDGNYKFTVNYCYKNADGKEEVLSALQVNSSSELSVGPGSSRGGKFIDIESLMNNFYCKIVLTDSNGNMDTYEIPLILTEVTNYK